MKAPLKLRESLKKINLNPSQAEIMIDEPMAAHCTFKVGGPADLLVRPKTPAALQAILAWGQAEGLPYFVLGGGANILVADAGIRGIVIDMTALDACSFQAQADGSTLMELQSGLAVSQATALAADRALAGLDFLYSMPGSVGGAVYMNARCYGSEIADVLVSVQYLDEDFSHQILIPDRASFKYKDTPFQGKPWIITGATVRLRAGDRDQIWAHMRSLEADRQAKGHFAAPCAGSVFKNNHDFGEPSGKIIDSLGLRGFAIGGAKVSDAHANIIINTGQAKAAEIKALIGHIQDRVKAERGFSLEPEVLLVGDWEGNGQPAV